MDNSRILVISDTQAPFHHTDTIKFLKHLNDRVQPTRVIHIGDEWDYSYLSFHGTSPDGLSPSVEMELAQEFVRQLSYIFPVMDIIESNHGALPYRKARAHGIPRALIKEYRDVLGAPSGWHWHPRLDIDTDAGKCRFVHGLESNALNSALNLGISIIQGHHHSRFDLSYRNGLFGMTIGCLIDDSNEVFNYNKTQSKRPQLGCAILINGIPMLIPMLLDEKRNWVGWA